MNVYLYNNTKRLSSTHAAPSVVDTLSCTLKDNCSFIEPVLRIKALTIPTFNYFKFEDRYYWLTNLVSLANNLWEIHGKVDPLTTFRGHIFNTSAFVLYDSTPNTQLPDNRLGIETDCDTYTSTANMPWYYTTGTSGTYFIATTGESDAFNLDFDFDGALPSITVQHDEKCGTGVYAIPYDQIRKLGFDVTDFINQYITVVTEQWRKINDSSGYRAQLAALNPQDPETAIKEFTQILINAGFDIFLETPTRILLLIAQNIIGGGNALSNIKASYWLPFTIPDSALAGTLGTNPTELALGTYTDIINGLKLVSDPIITAVDIDVAIPWHFNDWRDVSCTEIMLYIPLIGCINIPPEVVKGNDTLQVRFSLNLYSGELAAEVRCNSAQLGTYGTNCAMNILIGDSNINTGGAVNTVVAAATKQYAAAAGAAAETLAGMSTSVGGIGGGAGTGLTNEIVCTCRCHETSQNPSALLGTIGTPTRQLKTLSSSLGYCQCLNAQVNNAAISGEPNPTQTEIEMINNYLNTGVYLE